MERPRDPASLRITVRGRVQGVGFREALRAEALRQGVRGWVRNLDDGTVEAMLQGDPSGVQAVARWARTGPPHARVDEVRESVAAGEPACAGFERRPTARAAR